MMNLANMINSSVDVCTMSGKLSHNYRAAMHNAERVFQVCALVASGAYHDISNEPTVHVSCDTEVGVFAACACIGSAIACAETGVGARAYVIDAVSSAEERARVRSVATDIQRMCAHLSDLGIKAVPFSEVCACVSIL